MFSLKNIARKGLNMIGYVTLTAIATDLTWVIRMQF